MRSTGTALSAAHPESAPLRCFTIPVAVFRSFRRLIYHDCMRHTRSNRMFRAVSVFALVITAGCSESPPEPKYLGATGGDPAETRPTRTPTDRPTPIERGDQPSSDSSEPGVVRVAGISLTPVAEWSRVETSSPMRAAQFDAAGAEIVVFTFGPGQGGTVDDNLARWARLVLDDAGAPTMPEIDHFDIGDLHITVATYKGMYLAGTPGAEPTPQPGSTLVAAIIEGASGGSVFPRLVGPSAAVDAQRAAFDAFLRSVAPTP